jgi:hypothetical protein
MTRCFALLRRMASLARLAERTPKFAVRAIFCGDCVGIGNDSPFDKGGATRSVAGILTFLRNYRSGLLRRSLALVPRNDVQSCTGML